ncbi:transmembrane and ubiquitin-like domain-containing protein 2 [Asterias rubens]|uniref:transmembrane and ubiquitin-like domain-containing protein 2 n=1 Tax=Asterias rubens TaxID=7604 RepID=UPI001455CADE|nr:transmembrane and ubiquitin-like domain-containing protein 2 [Asterias rubens]XP_033646920.1 transmembrane and ubiquitin-like domain-containing protein 2 [Asterias rubens]XP_033646921.1 transmembrane and ubiquitin-like domain-containing protein 2 [Asterias rubens]XP_033646922.1 transmembrane and ubiquitin-like domain-containing protein 2 [Asterias rubens]
MSLIEGIGDEVTILVSILIISITLLIAWLSTSVSDRPNQRIPSSTIDATATEELINNTDARIEDAIFDSRWSGGTESVRTGPSAPTNSSAVNSNSTQDDLVASESIDSVSEPVASKDKESSNRTSLDTPQDSTVKETPAANVVRNRFTGQVSELQSNTIQSSSTDSNGQSQDATQTDGEGNQSDVVSDESQNNQGDMGQSEEPIHAEGQDQTAEGSICIRIKYLTDRERVVNAKPTDTLGNFRRQTFSEEIQSGQTVRLIFQGQLLQDDNTSLSDLNVTHNCVVHCHLSRGVAPSTVRQDVQEADIDLGRFMIPLFTSILGFVWYLRWQYRYMFNATSTLSLVGVTTLFVLAVLASWRG